jgi:hypothetical protein
MVAWIHLHGRLLSRIAFAAVIMAVFAPVISLFFGIPYLFGGVPYPPVNPMHVALTVSGLLAITGLVAGLAVWIPRAPGYELGRTAVLVLGGIIVMVGGIMLNGLLMSFSHSQRM